MSFINNLKIKLSSKKVGSDEFGNNYFEEKTVRYGNKKKRFIIYNGIVEASKIPSPWHRWIHYTSNEIPVNASTKKCSWQKIHLPNLSGTPYRYSPLKEGARKNVGSDYQSWQPNNTK